MGRHARSFEVWYRRVRENIFAFCEALGFEPTWQQREVLQAVQDGDLQIACKSGQGPGKTACSVAIALWRTLRHENSLTIVTAPTMRQCREVWLTELNLQLEKAHPFLKMLVKPYRSKVEIGGRQGWGIKLVTASKVEALQGYHRPNMSFIAEEASGISREIIETIKGTLSNPNAFFLQIGNPNTRDCSFFDCFNSQRHLWKTITLNAELTPASKWFDPARNTRISDEFGRESDVYRVRVLGEFPQSDPNCVMSSESLESCTTTDQYEMALIRRWTSTSLAAPAKQIGIDFSRYGGDESVVYRRSGNAIVEKAIFTKTEPAHAVLRAFRMQKEASWTDSQCIYVPDAGGMGQGVMHMFYDAKKLVMEFNNGTRSSDTQYANKITEAYFHLANLARRGELFLPKDNRLIQQLSTRQYYLNKKGKIILEEKEDYCKRGYDSPDRADAAVLTCYDEVYASANVARAQGSDGVGIKVTRA